MKKKQVTAAVFVLAFLCISLTVIIVLPAKAAMDYTQVHAAAKQGIDSRSMEKVYTKRLDAISKNIEKAISLLEAGNKEAALSELKKTINLAKNPDGAVLDNANDFANSQCPMMGGKIIPENVTESLTREFEGQKIAFCCGTCPVKWDELTEAQKKQKLSGSLHKKTEQTHSYRCS